MKFFGLKPSWKGLKNFLLSGFQEVYAQNDDITNEQKTSISDDLNLKPWKDLIMTGACAYSMMGKIFEEVLFSYKPKSNKFIEKWNFDDFILTKERFYVYGSGQHKSNIKGAFKYDKFNPYVELQNSIQTGGIKTEPCKYFANDTGMRQEYINPTNDVDGHFTHTLYCNSEFKHSAIVVDTNLEYKQSQNKMFVNVSTVLAHRFGNIGILAGIDFTNGYFQDSSWKQYCRAVSLGFVFPANAIRLTLQPNNNICTFNGYWKVNNALQVSSHFDINWRHPSSLGYANEIGLKYKVSDILTCGLKTNGNGDVTTGIWLTKKYFKLGIFNQFNIMPLNFGKHNIHTCFSVEFSPNSTN